MGAHKRTGVLHVALAAFGDSRHLPRCTDFRSSVAAFASPDERDGAAGQIADMQSAPLDPHVEEPNQLRNSPSRCW